jgi:hypothetical protein|tara:strand:+ start:1334 stop:1564 length:231 start_codon:yes stop_codon:yes gene_type:complete
MTYYLLINEEAVEIGEVSFDKFYAYDGWHHLNKMVNNKVTSLLERIQIVSDANKKFTIEEFLDEVSKYKIQIGNIV